MRGFLKENGCLAVMGVCLVCSAVLLVSVLTDRPLVAIASQHLPVLRVERAAQETAQPQAALPEESTQPAAETGGGYLLTEDFAESRLAAFLPEDFPAKDVEVSFENGLVQLSFDMERSGLKDYLKGKGIRLGTGQTLLLQMLPRQLELEGDFTLSADEKGLHLVPVRLEAGDREFSLAGLPKDTFSALDGALNALLENAGVRFSAAEFTDGGILLK